MTNEAYCIAKTKAGMPCRMPPMVGSPYCYTHDPALVERRIEVSRKGGHNRSTAVRLRKLVPPRLVSVFDELEQALKDVKSGALDPRRASAMAQLARAMVAVMTAGELEERVRSLEQQQGEER